jgi:aspartyl-tRNA(Asn)/glutamyl-tRNA(Gln) amidotransferase subunit A
MYSSYDELRYDLETGKISLEEVVREYLSNIDKGKHLNAFLYVFGDQAIVEARRVQEKIRNKKAGKLAGMVIAVKDVLSIKDKPLTCASKILGNFNALYTCTAVQNLIDEDAIIIGKTNCDEFAMGSSNENSAYGVVRNPHGTDRVPGGSSGGSGVAVSADMCMAALGTDTGGSIRQPAAFCGAVGFKPTYGRVSRYGLTAFASSFDTIGVFAKTVQDCTRVTEVISGYDKNDSTCVNTSVPGYYSELTKKINEKEINIGILDNLKFEGLQDEIKKVIGIKIDELKRRGFSIKPVALPHVKYSIQTYYILTTAEASSNLARYDGARYGVRSKDADILEDMYVNSRSEGFGTEVKRRIMLGTYVLSAGYYDAYYKKAQKVRRLIRNDFKNAFKSVDFIIAPTTPSTAFRIGEKIDDPLEMYLTDVFTTSANLSGNPAISIPVGNDGEGLPIGMQIIGKHFDESGVLRISNYIMNNC